MHGFSSKMERKKERHRELKVRTIEITQSNKERENKLETKMNRASETCETKCLSVDFSSAATEA